MPALNLNSSPPTCVPLPMPDEPKLTWPGFCWRERNQILHVVHAEAGRHVAISIGVLAICVMPAKSFSVSYGRFVYSAALPANTDDVEQQRVPVGRRTGDDAAGDRAARARPVVDHHLLSPAFEQLGAEHARDYIGRAARRERHHHADRLAWIAWLRWEYQR